MRHGPDGGVLDVGRRTRTISPALRRALAARDGKCRFPGCTARRCDAHHIEHWADGGETALPNLVLLWRRHHRAVHEGRFRLHVDADGKATFLRPGGRPLPEAPEAPSWDGPALAPVDLRLAAAGIGIDADTAPRWQGERLDLGWPSACCGARDRRRPRAGRSRGNVRTVTAGGRSRQRLSSVLGAGAVPRSAPRPSRDPASLSRRHSPRVPAEACHLPSRRWPPTVEPAVGRGGLSYIAVGGDP